MIVTFFLLILFIGFFAHLIFLPLSKRRPVILKGIEGAVFITIFLLFIASILQPVIYIIGIVVGLFIYYKQSWIIYGISFEDSKNALDRAILATRAVSSKEGNTYTIDNSLSVTFKNLGIKISYVAYNSHTYSKKAALTKEIFRKFVQNYFV